MGKEWDKFGGKVEPDVQSAGGFEKNYDGGSNPFSGSRVHLGIAGSPYQHWTQAWATEALRVLKPGGSLLSFGGTRTFHRLTCGLEDAGFVIKDCLAWLYGQGFPKSQDLGKMIDRRLGCDREVVGGKSDLATKKHTGSVRLQRRHCLQGWADSRVT